MPAVFSLGIALFSWDANSETDLAGYNVYANGKRVVHIPLADLNDPANPSFLVELPEGVYTFAVTAYNESGLESDFSNTVDQEHRWP